MGIKIQVETPSRDICSWSFVGIGALDSAGSRSLRKTLLDEHLLDKRRVCWDTHPILKELVDREATGQDSKSCRDKLIKLLSSFAEPKLDFKTATAVADYLIDKALLTAFVKIKSEQVVPVGDLVRKALADTRKWLDEVDKVAPLPLGSAPVVKAYSAKNLSPTTFEEHRQAYHANRDEYLCSGPPVSDKMEWLRNRLKVVQKKEETPWRMRDLELSDMLSPEQIKLLGDIYKHHNLYDDYRNLQCNHAKVLADLPQKIGDRDTQCQLESCSRMLLEIAQFHPQYSLESAGQLRDRCTQLLIKFNAVVEHALGRVAHRLVYWPNLKFPSGNRLCASNACLKSHLEEKMRENALLLDDSESGVDLRKHYPQVWQKFEDMQPYHYYATDKGADSWWGALIALINTAKHGRPLDIKWTPDTTVSNATANRLTVDLVVDRWQRSSFADCFPPGGAAQLRASNDFYEHQRKHFMRKDETMRSGSDLFDKLKKANDFVESVKQPQSDMMKLLLCTDSATWDSNAQFSKSWRQVVPQLSPALAKAVPILCPKKFGSKEFNDLRARDDLRARTVLKLCKKWVQMFCVRHVAREFGERKRFDFLPFAKRILRDVRAFVEACDNARHQTTELINVAKSGGSLGRFLDTIVLDRADMAGKTALHWACSRGDKAQVATLRKRPQSFKRAMRKHRPDGVGKTPMELARKHFDSVKKDGCLIFAMLNDPDANLVDVAEMIRAEARKLFESKEFAKAAGKYANALECAELVPAKNLIITLKLYRAMACIKSGKNQEGIDLATTVIKIEGKKDTVTDILVKAYYWLAKGYSNMKKPKEKQDARKLYKQFKTMLTSDK